MDTERPHPPHGRRRMAPSGLRAELGASRFSVDDGQTVPRSTANVGLMAGTTAANATILSDIEAFAQFMRLLAPPVPSTTTPGGSAAITADQQLFTSVGCAVCHTPSISKTQPSNITASLGSQPGRLILPATVDAENINPSRHHGVLEIVIPKQPKAQPRRIEVK